MGFTQTPDDTTDSDIPDFAYTYTVMMADGITAAPAWITVVDDGDGTYSIRVDKDADDGQAPAVLDLKLVATVVGQTTAKKSVDWQLTMYTYVPSTLADQVYVINTA